MTTSRLALPQLAPAQAAKHIIVNEALERLDAAVQLSVSGTQTAPPDPAEPGLCVRVGSPASGIFSGQEDRIAALTEGGWIFLSPRAGWVMWDASLGGLQVHDGSDWQILESGGSGLADRVAQLGINADADASTVLSVTGDATLLNGSSGSHRLYLNRATSADVASLVLQTGFTGQAEIGLSGSGGLAVRTSADGSQWADALSVDTASGTVTGKGLATGEQVTHIFDSGDGSGIYTVPDGVRALRIEAQGGGGGGAGAENTSTANIACAGGGGGGGYASVTLTGSLIAASYSYAVGGGGLGGSATSGDPTGARDGGDGGDTTISGVGTSLIARGGKGAVERAESASYNQYSGGVGGAALGGDLRIAGQWGQGGLADGTRGFFTGNGRGGDSHLGLGGAYANGNGRDGTGFGAGGAGAGMVPGLVLNRAGGDGTGGVIRITEFY